MSAGEAERASTERGRWRAEVGAGQADSRCGGVEEQVTLDKTSTRCCSRRDCTQSILIYFCILL